MHYDMFDLIGLILELPPKAPVPTYRHSIHLHSKRCRIALGRTWQKLLQRYPFLASTRIRLPWFLPTCCALGQHNSPRTHNAVQYHQYPKKTQLQRSADSFSSSVDLLPVKSTVLVAKHPSSMACWGPSA